MNNEQWEPVPGYGDAYQVSSLGNIRSIDRLVPHGKGDRYLLGVVLKIHINKKGYHTVGLSHKGLNQTCKVHRLVAHAFLQDSTEERNQINHKDGDKDNNSSSNLEWCTHTENQQHAFDTGLKTNAGESHPQAQLNQWKIRVIRRLYEQGYFLQREIGVLFGIKQSGVSRICLRKRWW